MLPDYLAPNLEIIFVGLNPGEYSNRVGHYFARSQNLFWPALYASGLVPTPLSAKEDARILEFGYGLTDLVKRATPNVDQVTPAEFIRGGQELRAKLAPLTPKIVCFVGLVGYRQAFQRQAMPGPQSERWGRTQLFIVPSTSPRNAHYRPSIQSWFDQLRLYRDQNRGGAA